jgi:hypothetical protein
VFGQITFSRRVDKQISGEYTVGIKGYETKQEKVSHSGVSVGIFLKGPPPLLLGADLSSRKRLE